MSIIKTNEGFWYLYGPAPKGIFNNEEINKLVGELCERVPLKETAKA